MTKMTPYAFIPIIPDLLFFFFHGSFIAPFLPLSSHRPLTPQPSPSSKTSTPFSSILYAPSTPNIAASGVRTSSYTKEEVDAILIQCRRLSRSSSGRAASSSGGRKYSGSKRSFDFDHCDNDANSNNDDQRRGNATTTDNSDLCEEYDGVATGNRHRAQHRQHNRQSPRPSPRRRPQAGNGTSSRIKSPAVGKGGPGKLMSIPATVTSLVMDKSNNGIGGGESAAATSVKRITVKRNVGECGVAGSRGAASPRSQSPARAQSPTRALLH
ncbi:hypothetical protein S245_011825 [Arachis hypogaea]